VYLQFCASRRYPFGVTHIERAVYWDCETEDAWIVPEDWAILDAADCTSTRTLGTKRCPIQIKTPSPEITAADSRISIAEMAARKRNERHDDCRIIAHFPKNSLQLDAEGADPLSCLWQAGACSAISHPLRCPSLESLL
jgi:hypothetical protein